MTATALPKELSYNKAQIIFAVLKMRFINISRYKGQLILDAIIPIVIASMPILLGRAAGGRKCGCDL